MKMGGAERFPDITEIVVFDGWRTTTFQNAPCHSNL